MRFRKRPVIVEASQITDGMFDTDGLTPFGFDLLSYVGVTYDRTNRRITIETLEGTMIGNVGDWVICGVNGELYPCKPDIFAKTYERVDSPPCNPNEPCRPSE